MRPQNRPLKGFTKKQLLTATLLMLDEHVKHMECDLISKVGNIYCDVEYTRSDGVVCKWHNCTNCMLNQYLDKAKEGDISLYEKLVLRNGSD